MFTVAIADRDRSFGAKLAQFVDGDGLFRVVGNAWDGEQALQMLEQLKPDIILMDPMLEKIDGTFILFHLREHWESYQPKIYILSGIGTDPYIKLLNQLRIDFYSIKPVYPSIVLQNLHHIVEGAAAAPRHGRQAGESRKRLVNDIIAELGIPINLLSAKQLQDAILLCLEDEDNLRGLTTELYRKVGLIYNTTHTAVERNIRSCIHHMQRNGSLLYKSIFHDGQITNSLFLVKTVHYIQQCSAHDLAHQNRSAQ